MAPVAAETATPAPAARDNTPVLLTTGAEGVELSTEIPVPPTTLFTVPPEAVLLIVIVLPTVPRLTLVPAASVSAPLRLFTVFTVFSATSLRGSTVAPLWIWDA